ncbi:MAG: hypothetical protein AB7C91_12320 [Sphaerochaeta sp.]|uniref:hypothetical protein n=1 Tax=Sphaerochaeta sp. TaxID=1972642 RepID=UPI003D0E680D
MSFKKVVISIVCLMLVSSLVFAGAQKEQAPVAGSSVVLRMSWWGNNAGQKSIISLPFP